MIDYLNLCIDIPQGFEWRWCPIRVNVFCWLFRLAFLALPFQRFLGTFIDYVTARTRVNHNIVNVYSPNVNIYQLKSRSSSTTNMKCISIFCINTIYGFTYAFPTIVTFRVTSRWPLETRFCFIPCCKMTSLVVLITRCWTGRTTVISSVMTLTPTSETSLASWTFAAAHGNTRWHSSKIIYFVFELFHIPRLYFCCFQSTGNSLDIFQF